MISKNTLRIYYQRALTPSDRHHRRSDITYRGFPEAGRVVAGILTVFGRAFPLERRSDSGDTPLFEMATRMWRDLIPSSVGWSS